MKTRHWTLGLAAGAALVLAACGGGGSQEPAPGQPETAQALASSEHPAAHLLIPGGPIVAKVNRVDPRLHGAKGQMDVWVSLAEQPLAVRKRELRPLLADGDRWKATDDATLAQMRAHRQQLRAGQDAMLDNLVSLGGRELGRVSRAHNAVAVRIDASRLGQLAKLPGVIAVRPVIHYRKTLPETVPGIGATVPQKLGFDGRGVTVAVLDSGIDYTHAAFGGKGTRAAYQAAYANVTSRDGLFPTAKVIEGFDFVGETWPNCRTNTDGTPIDCRSEDDDPIDAPSTDPTAGGHGTHVADIIAGKLGVAPGAKLLAVKVCSAVSSSCNGVALLKAIDFALDPNGDGDLSDAADVINLSLGSDYGQKEDDLSFALANAVKLGAVVVASAGNGSNRPYVAGSPSVDPAVISVAQTHVPSALAFPLIINSPPPIAGSYPDTASVEWAPLTGTVTGNVAFAGRGCIGDVYPNNPSGKIALIDRGACAVSEKVRRASDAGATGVLIGLIAPGDPVSFSNGGECPAPADRTCKSTLVITLAVANLIKANINAPVNVTMSSTAGTIALVGGMVGSSSRGPSYSFNAIKPDIAAPGASVSAVVASGTGTEAFSGTSGAAPMVSGAAAILRGAFPNRSPAEIKSVLMNTASTQVYTNLATMPGALAPITRIGGGEVRVLNALVSFLAAWDEEDRTGSLSFGYHTITDDRTFKRKVVVRNYAPVARTLRISPNFRFAEDELLGAVAVKTPGSLTVPAHGRASFDVQLQVKASKLPTWTLNGGSQGGNGELLDGPEFDGYLTLSDNFGEVHLAWHILPHKASDIEASDDRVRAGDSVKLSNTGAVDGRVEVFSLTGKSRKTPSSQLPGAGDNFALIDMKSVGVRGATIDGEAAVQFAIDTNGARAHPNYPAEFDIFIDTNDDGVEDFVVFNSELGGFGATGQNAVNVFDLTTGEQVTRFFNDADLNSSNVIFTALLSDLGLTPASKFRFSVYAFDNYFSGAQTDEMLDMIYTIGKPRYVAGGVPQAGVPVDGSSQLTVQSVPGGAAASPSQSGFLLLYRDGALKNEAERIDVNR